MDKIKFLKKQIKKLKERIKQLESIKEIVEKEEERPKIIKKSLVAPLHTDKQTGTDRQTVFKENAGYYANQNERLLKEGYKIIEDTKEFTVYEKKD